MTKVEKLDQILMPDYQQDYWSDDVIIWTSELAEQLNDDDWNVLLHIWRERSSGWQQRLADVLFGCTHQQATTLLVELLQSTDMEVAFLAAEGLEDRSHWIPLSTLQNVLKQFSEQAEEWQQPMIDVLIARIIF